MRSKAMFMALLAFAFQTQAASVSQSQAVTTVRNWARSGSVLGARLGAAIDAAKVKTYDLGSGAAFHAVPFKDGGMVFVSANTESEPIVAFTSSSNVDLSEESPLYRLLKLDAKFRAGVAARRTATTTTSTVQQSLNRKWTSLSSTTASAAPIDEKHASQISDIRVKPLLETRWSQSTVGGIVNCYNYYTPNNYVCGCTATAASQIMRYFKYPEQFAAPDEEYACVIDGEKVMLKALTEEGEEETIAPYDWDNMLAKPSATSGEEVFKAIGHLTRDVAVALESDFTGGETGASPSLLAKMFRQSFGYANALVYDDNKYYKSGGLHNDGTRRKVIYSNLDAGKPVLLAIYGYAKDKNGKPLTSVTGGHAVVADGYGFVGEGVNRTEYVHVNLGWGGTDDAWYNIPEIDTATAGAKEGDSSGYDFAFLNCAAYNIATEAAESDKDILSGRITDEEGLAVKDAKVTIWDAVNGTSKMVKTDANGIYYAYLDGNANYQIRAELDDGRFGETAAPVLLKHSVVGESISNLVSSISAVGNSWGNDLTVMLPTVRIVTSGVTNLYARLEQAIAAAPADAVLEIIEPSILKQDCTIEKNCTITSAIANPYATPVTCENGAMISVQQGKVVFSNIVFEATSTVVRTLGLGEIALAGTAVFNKAGASAPGIIVDKAEHFSLIGELMNGLLLECSGASLAHEAFGFYYGDLDSASRSAARIITTQGNNRAGKAENLVVGLNRLVWEDGVAADETVAVGYIDGVTKTYFRSLDEMIATASAGANLVLMVNKIALTERHSINGNLTLTSECGGTEIVVENQAGFDISAGEVAVSKVSFSDYKGNGIFVVKGATSSLTIKEVAFTNIEGTNYHSGAVAALDKSKVKLLGNVMFSNCRASGVYSTTRRVNSYGGAIYVDANSKLELMATEGAVKIAGCSAATMGGGIYTKSQIDLAGDITIKNNTSNAGADDIYLYDANAKLVCVGNITSGAKSIGVFGGVDGDAFATFTSNVSAATSTKVAFFNDRNVELNVAIKGSNFCWTSDRDLLVSAAEAVCSVTIGSTTNYYASIEDAIESGNSVITITDDAYLTRDLVINGNVKIVSEGSSQFTITRKNELSVIVTTGSSLTLENITLNGGSEKVSTGLIKVDGGSLTLASGAEICEVRGSADRASGAVTVWNGGTITMESGSSIHDCINKFIDVGTGGAYGAGLLVEDGANAYLRGGEIYDCSSASSAGVFIGSKSTCYISGDFAVSNNCADDGRDNLCVSDDSFLILSAAFNGYVKCSEGYNADPNVIGKVSSSFTGDVQAAAHRFMHDITYDYGMAVTDGKNKLLVWGSALDPATGRYTDADGHVYNLVSGEKVQIPLPMAYSPLVYDGTAQCGVDADVGYTIEGNVATNAGNYTATVTLRPGFAWDVAADAVQQINWSIAKAEYDLSDIVFIDYETEYKKATMQYHPGIVGALPEWLNVAYSNNGREAVGTNEVTAVISGTNENYQDVNKVLTAKLIITAVAGSGEKEPDPPVPPAPIPVICPPFNCTSITGSVTGCWMIVVSPVKKYCTYTLKSSTDLMNWNSIETRMCDTDAGSMVFEMPSSVDRRFWTVDGEDGVMPQ